MSQRPINAWASRAAAPAVLAATAAAILASGDFAPRWSRGFASLVGLPELAALRLIAGCLFAAGLGALAVRRWSRGLALCGLCLATLLALATISASLRGPFVTLGVAIAFALVAGLTFLTVARQSPDAYDNGPSDAWRVLGVLALATIALGGAAALPARERTPTARPHAKVSGSGEAVDLMINRWEGRRLEEVGLFEHLPALKPLVGKGITYLIFYNPRCGHCHQLFEEHFAHHVDAKVIAIKIPVTERDDLLPTDQPEDIDCPECTRLTLPAGVLWVITPPTVIRVEDGVVRCASEPPSKKNCIDG